MRIVPLDDSPTLTEMVPFATIATAALIELGVIASDETPIPSDQALMLDKVASVHAALDAQGVVWWPVGSIPRAFTEEYTKLTAAMAGSSFGKAIDPAIVALLEARVRKGAMVLSADNNAQQAVQAVHDDLVMRGIARWTVPRHPRRSLRSVCHAGGRCAGTAVRWRHRPERHARRDGGDLPLCGAAIERRDRVDRVLLNPTRFAMAYRLNYSDYSRLRGRLIRRRGLGRLGLWGRLGRRAPLVVFRRPFLLLQ